MYSMDTLFLGRTCTLIGEVLIAVMVLWVHHKVEKDKKIDKGVIRTLRQEWFIALLGVMFLSIGYILEIISV